MTLDEAIKHCEDNVEKEKRNCNHACAHEHEQLMHWLIQLKNLMGECY